MQQRGRRSRRDEPVEIIDEITHTLRFVIRELTRARSAIDLRSETVLAIERHPVIAPNVRLW